MKADTDIPSPKRGLFTPWMAGWFVALFVYFVAIQCGVPAWRQWPVGSDAYDLATIAGIAWFLTLRALQPYPVRP